VPDWDGEREPPLDRDADGETLCDCVSELVADDEPVGLGDFDTVTDGDHVRELAAEPVGERERDGDALFDGEPEYVSLSDGDGDCDGESEGDALVDGERDPLAERDAHELDAVGDGERDADGVRETSAERDGELDSDGDGDWLDDALDVRV